MTAATLLLSSYFTCGELLGDEFDALLSSTSWAGALQDAANWAIDRYYDNRLAGVDEEGVAGTFWIEEVEPRARRLSKQKGAIDAFYVAALLAILDDYWKVAPQSVSDERAVDLARLRELVRRAIGDPSTLRPGVGDAAAELANAWHATVERLSSS